MTVPLTDAARSVWGKTDRKGLSPIGWLPLYQHLLDTTEVAQRLWDHWLSPAITRQIGAGLPGGNDDGRVLLCWLAGIHDIGKATPAFAVQAMPFAERMRERGLDFTPEIIAQRRILPHATAGHIILTDWLTGSHDWATADDYAIVVGGHHGIPPTHSDLQRANTHRRLFGDDAWISVQYELLTWMTAHTGAMARLPQWSTAPLSQPVQALLTGLVIVADWIASNEEYFPYELNPDQQERVGLAWESVRMPPPWQPRAAPSTVEELFAGRFQLPVGAKPRPVQHTVTDIARTMPTPGMIIVEAAMGEGKTEAALAAVEILAERTGASGCYLALPTRATSDAMFNRVLDWLKCLPDARIGRVDRDVMLAHGKAAFNDDLYAMRWTSLPSGIGVDEGGVDIGVNKWLAGRGRSMLSSFVVGTIDQLLFAALRSRHLVLRHLGFAGKVVVIDEAHAYDVYMSVFLDRTLEWLGAYGVPVVVLSATLPAGRRAELMAAYDTGRLGTPPRLTWRDRGRIATDHYAELRTDLRYPLVTVSATGRGGIAHGSADSGRSIEVKLCRLDDDPETLISLMRSRLAGGGCALIIRNTVARVQETAASLRSALGPDFPVSVAHSRFMAPDRAAKDTWLRDTFGPSGHRPARHIVVASQVAEQSLDIDFDLLVTDLSPVDLVLQRIGRLHRHVRIARPPLVSSATCYVAGADWSAVPPKPVAGSRRVYQEAALLRAAAVLGRFIGGGVPLRLPSDISGLTQAAYGDGQVGPADWQEAMEKAQHRMVEERADKERRAKAFRLDGVDSVGQPLLGWLTGGVGDADESTARGHVRDSDGESLEVILLVRTDAGLVIPPWAARDGNVLVPADTVPTPRLAKSIARCTLPLPRMMTAAKVIDGVITELERRNHFPAWEKNPWLGGELVLDLDQNGHAAVGRFDLHYDIHEGLRVSQSN